ncbi:MAG: hypothetical protein Q7R81_06360 [Candidatus Peregrinibacteria bacterium]|nr:hypothetical protein [Candidatus Peregrinibacteria bacterium]
MGRTLPLVLLLLTACSSLQDVSLYDARGKLVGGFTVDGSGSSIVRSADGERIATARDGVVRSTAGIEWGRVVENGYLDIHDEEGTLVGSIRAQTDCYNDAVVRMGRASKAVLAEAIGAACLTLLLRPQTP